MTRVRSKFSEDTFFVGFIMLLNLALNIAMFVKCIEAFVFYPIVNSIIGLLLFMLIVILLLIIRQIKYIIVKSDRLICFSLLCPFGKRLYFKNFKGIVIAYGQVKSRSYKVIHFVNNKGRVTFKIVGLRYSNYEEIKEAIPLGILPNKLKFIDMVKLFFSFKINVNKNRL
ncbi:hypothetical protein DEU42_103245 [Flavobacterium sp. AG291]|nr:hypothetical protein DEU42_103245 [Flavobacterium sp. AG291]